MPLKQRIARLILSVLFLAITVSVIGVVISLLPFSLIPLGGIVAICVINWAIVHA